ncbi:MAG: Gfo/Idh/MocA family oxidoreductase, partial [Verrucomicrobiia bacterium]
SQKRLTGGGFSLKYAPRNTYRAEIEDFSAAVLGKRKPLVDAEEALWNLRVCLAAYRAARTRKAVGI